MQPIIQNEALRTAINDVFSNQYNCTMLQSYAFIGIDTAQKIIECFEQWNIERNSDFGNSYDLAKAILTLNIQLSYNLSNDFKDEKRSDVLIEERYKEIIST